MIEETDAIFIFPNSKINISSKFPLDLEKECSKRMHYMNSIFHSTLIATVSSALLAFPLLAQQPNTPSSESGTDKKESRMEFQKAMNQAKKDPEVAAALKAANMMALNKVAVDNPNLAEMANKEIAKLDKAAGKPAAGEKPDADAKPKKNKKDATDGGAQSKEDA